MSIKTYAICLYIVFVYWISVHIPHMHALFFPTLGAFSLLFISRPYERSAFSKIALGAVVASTIGSLFVYWSSGVVSLLLTLLLVIWLINLFKWNAPPILAVSLIPFFTQPPLLWVIPVSVCIALLGLLFTLSAATYLEQKFGHTLTLFKRTVKTGSDRTM